MKDCSKCGQTKPEVDFYLKKGKPTARCKECTKAAQKEYAQGRGLQQVRLYRAAHRDHRNQQRRDWYLGLREAAIKAYGGLCVCCGEEEYAFLVFDHVDGGGMRERMEMYGGKRGRSGGHRFLIWLREHDYPSHIQVLCANCNMAKYFRVGGCPHAGS